MRVRVPSSPLFASLFLWIRILGFELNIWDIAQLAEQETLNFKVAGSIPAIPILWIYIWVVGSSAVQFTFKKH